MKNHEKLINHIESLLEDTEAKHFHDFESDFAMPKVMLVNRLNALVENVKNGIYDDTP